MSTRQESELDLLEAARAGDEGALEMLLERHQDRVYRFGMKMCRDPEEAQDVLQETLLAMARGIRDFRGSSSLSTWLYAIARSSCIKKRRRRRSAAAVERSLDTDTVPEAERLRDPARGPDEELASRQIESALDDAIGALEPRYREVFLLRDVEGLTAPEVAETLRLSVQAVKSRLHRSRLAVRARVAPLIGFPAVTGPAAAACPDVLSLLSKHLENDITAEACAAMERHVAACERCRGACDSLKRTLALCRTVPRPPVPVALQGSVRAAIRKVLA